MRLSLQSYIYKGALKLDNIIGSSAKNLGSSKGNNHPWPRVEEWEEEKAARVSAMEVT